MRFLSQDGMIEVEYERCVLAVNSKKCEIEAYTSNPEFTPIMASYSSVEKCRKAMDALHEAYIGTLPILQDMEISDDVKEMFEKWKKQGICVASKN